MRYRLNDSFLHDGRDYPKGAVLDLSDDDAARLPAWSIEKIEDTHDDDTSTAEGDPSAEDDAGVDQSKAEGGEEIEPVAAAATARPKPAKGNT